MKRLLSDIRQLFFGLAGDERGNMMMYVGFSIMALVGASGSAIDMGRAQYVQARMSSALDAAGLAAGAIISTQDAQETASRYFYANFKPGFMDVEITSLTAVPSADNTKINLSVSGTVQTTLMKVLGVDEVEVSATAEVTRSMKGMELVLVLDNTGSMTSTAGGGVSKINALKSAGNDLIDILYGENETIEDLWVGIVPFSQAVNIGSSRTSWVSGTFNWGTTSWMGCVDARETSGRDVTDDPPSVALFPRYYWPCHTSYNAWYGTNYDRDNCSTSGTIRYKSGLGTSRGPNKSCSQAVLPMTAVKSTIATNINSMQAVGNTHVNLGMAWGWRMLSPRWRGLWGGEMDTNNLPLDYNTDLMNKVVILMTDGDNTMSNSVRSAYWYLSDGRLGTTSSSAAVDELDERTTEVCNSMKDNNVLIYTIALGTNLNADSLAVLESCASGASYFFNSPTTDDLSNAFHMIGDSLANLHLSR